MVYQGNLLSKTLVIGIIILFIGISIVPSASSTVIKAELPVELIIDGPTHGLPGESLDYIFILVGPEECEVWYYIDWGDGTNTGWIGPFMAGDEALASHTWYECGIYTIQAIAKCNGSHYNASLVVTISSDMITIPITVYEAWELLTDTSNGIQTPIDIRTAEEWNESFIYTRYPEHPVHFSLEKLQTPDGLQEFIDIYEGKEIAPYSTNNMYKFLLMLYILEGANYSGTIYYWNGGFTTWVEAGQPIRNNTPPYAPVITGSHPRARQPTKGLTKNYTFTTRDPDGDKICLYIDWGDGDTEGWVGPYDSGEKVKLNHTYIEQGAYIVKAKAKDIFDAEGPWGVEQVPCMRSRQMINSWFQWFFERFQLLEVFLRAMNLLR